MKWIFENKLQILQICMTVAGWFAAFGFGVIMQRRNVQSGVKLKVFEEFWRLRNLLQDSMNTLSSVILTGPPFSLMKSTDVYGSITNNPEDIWRGQQDAIKFLNNYMTELFNAKSNFTTTYLNFLRALEMWLHVMPSLQKAADDLFAEYDTLNHKINEHYNFFQISNIYRWKEWDEDQIRVRCQMLYDDINNGLKCYTEDIMTLIHNELLNAFFDYRKELRKPLDTRYKVLTREGLMMITTTSNMN